MGVRRLTRAGLTAAAALALGALSASAQTVTYSTAGAFSGGTGGTVCTATSCTSGGFTLSFLGDASTSYIAPSTIIDLGQFQTQAVEPTQGLTAFNGVQFTLTILQTSPSNGSSTFSGAITGSLAYNPTTSTLVWSPTTTSTIIGAATYTLTLDNSNNLRIQAPATPGQNPNLTSVKGGVSVTPEPATALLLAPGLAGMGLAARSRRRRSSK